MNNGYINRVLNDTQIGFRFAMPANSMFCERAIIDPNMIIGELISDLGVAYLLYYGYQNNCMVKEVEPEYKLEFFVDFVEDAMFDEGKKNILQEISDCFREARVTKKVMETIKTNTDSIVEEVKKKMTQKIGKKSNRSHTGNLDSPQEIMPDAP